MESSRNESNTSVDAGEMELTTLRKTYLPMVEKCLKKKDTDASLKKLHGVLHKKRLPTSTLKSLERLLKAMEKYMKKAVKAKKCEETESLQVKTNTCNPNLSERDFSHQPLAKSKEQESNSKCSLELSNTNSKCENEKRFESDSTTCFNNPKVTKSKTESCTQKWSLTRIDSESKTSQSGSIIMPSKQSCLTSTDTFAVPSSSSEYVQYPNPKLYLKHLMYSNEQNTVDGESIHQNQPENTSQQPAEELVTSSSHNSSYQTQAQNQKSSTDFSGTMNTSSMSLEVQSILTKLHMSKEVQCILTNFLSNHKQELTQSAKAPRDNKYPVKVAPELLTQNPPNNLMKCSNTLIDPRRNSAFYQNNGIAKSNFPVQNKDANQDFRTGSNIQCNNFSNEASKSSSCNKKIHAYGNSVEDSKVSCAPYHPRRHHLLLENSNSFNVNSYNNHYRRNNLMTLTSNTSTQCSDPVNGQMIQQTREITSLSTSKSSLTPNTNFLQEKSNITNNLLPKTSLKRNYDARNLTEVNILYPKKPKLTNICDSGTKFDIYENRVNKNSGVMVKDVVTSQTSLASFHNTKVTNTPESAANLKTQGEGGRRNSSAKNKEVVGDNNRQTGKPKLINVCDSLTNKIQEKKDKKSDVKAKEVVRDQNPTSATSPGTLCDQKTKYKIRENRDVKNFDVKKKEIDGGTTKTTNSAVIQKPTSSNLCSLLTKSKPKICRDVGYSDDKVKETGKNNTAPASSLQKPKDSNLCDSVVKSKVKGNKDVGTSNKQEDTIVSDKNKRSVASRKRKIPMVCDKITKPKIQENEEVIKSDNKVKKPAVEKTQITTAVSLKETIPKNKRNCQLKAEPTKTQSCNIKQRTEPNKEPAKQDDSMKNIKETSDTVCIQSGEENNAEKTVDFMALLGDKQNSSDSDVDNNWKKLSALFNNPLSSEVIKSFFQCVSSLTGNLKSSVSFDEISSTTTISNNTFSESLVEESVSKQNGVDHEKSFLQGKKSSIVSSSVQDNPFRPEMELSNSSETSLAINNSVQLQNISIVESLFEDIPPQPIIGSTERLSEKDHLSKTDTPFVELQKRNSGSEKNEDVATMYDLIKRRKLNHNEKLLQHSKVLTDQKCKNANLVSKVCYPDKLVSKPLVIKKCKNEVSSSKMLSKESLTENSDFKQSSSTLLCKKDSNDLKSGNGMKKELNTKSLASGATYRLISKSCQNKIASPKPSTSKESAGKLTICEVPTSERSETDTVPVLNQSSNEITTVKQISVVNQSEFDTYTKPSTKKTPDMFDKLTNDTVKQSTRKTAVAHKLKNEMSADKSSPVVHQITDEISTANQSAENILVDDHLANKTSTVIQTRKTPDNNESTDVKTTVKNTLSANQPKKKIITIPKRPVVEKSTGEISTVKHPLSVNQPTKKITTAKEPVVEKSTDEISTVKHPPSVNQPTKKITAKEPVVEKSTDEIYTVKHPLSVNQPTKKTTTAKEPVVEKSTNEIYTVKHPLSVNQPTKKITTAKGPVVEKSTDEIYNVKHPLSVNQPTKKITTAKEPVVEKSTDEIYTVKPPLSVNQPTKKITTAKEPVVEKSTDEIYTVKPPLSVNQPTKKITTAKEPVVEKSTDEIYTVKPPLSVNQPTKKTTTAKEPVVEKSTNEIYTVKHPLSVNQPTKKITTAKGPVVEKSTDEIYNVKHPLSVNQPTKKTTTAKEPVVEKSTDEIYTVKHPLSVNQPTKKITTAKEPVVEKSTDEIYTVKPPLSVNQPTKKITTAKEPVVEKSTDEIYTVKHPLSVNQPTKKITTAKEPVVEKSTDETSTVKQPLSVNQPTKKITTAKQPVVEKSTDETSTVKQPLSVNQPTKKITTAKQPVVEKSTDETSTVKQPLSVNQPTKKITTAKQPVVEKSTDEIYTVKHPLSVNQPTMKITTANQLVLVPDVYHVRNKKSVFLQPTGQKVCFKSTNIHTGEVSTVKQPLVFIKSTKKKSTTNQSVMLVPDVNSLTNEKSILLQEQPQRKIVFNKSTNRFIVLENPFANELTDALSTVKKPPIVNHLTKKVSTANHHLANKSTDEISTVNKPTKNTCIANQSAWGIPVVENVTIKVPSVKTYTRKTPVANKSTNEVSIVTPPLVFNLLTNQESTTNQSVKLVPHGNSLTNENSTLLKVQPPGNIFSKQSTNESTVNQLIVLNQSTKKTSVADKLTDELSTVKKPPIVNQSTKKISTTNHHLVNKSTDEISTVNKPTKNTCIANQSAWGIPVVENVTIKVPSVKTYTRKTAVANKSTNEVSTVTQPLVFNLLTKKESTTNQSVMLVPDVKSSTNKESILLHVQPPGNIFSKQSTNESTVNQLIVLNQSKKKTPVADKLTDELSTVKKPPIVNQSTKKKSTANHHLVNKSTDELSTVNKPTKSTCVANQSARDIPVVDNVTNKIPSDRRSTRKTPDPNKSTNEVSTVTQPLVFNLLTNKESTTNQSVMLVPDVKSSTNTESILLHVQPPGNIVFNKSTNESTVNQLIVLNQSTKKTPVADKLTDELSTVKKPPIVNQSTKKKSTANHHLVNKSTDELSTVNKPTKSTCVANQSARDIPVVDNVTNKIPSDRRSTRKTPDPNKSTNEVSTVTQPLVFNLLTNKESTTNQSVMLVPDVKSSTNTESILLHVQPPGNIVFNKSTNESTVNQLIVLNQSTKKTPVADKLTDELSTVKKLPIVNQSTKKISTANHHLVNKSADEISTVNKPTKSTCVANQSARDIPVVDNVTNKIPSDRRSTRKTPVANKSTNEVSTVNMQTSEIHVLKQTTEKILVCNQSASAATQSRSVKAVVQKSVRKNQSAKKISVTNPPINAEERPVFQNEEINARNSNKSNNVLDSSSTVKDTVSLRDESENVEKDEWLLLASDWLSKCDFSKDDNDIGVSSTIESTVSGDNGLIDAFNEDLEITHDDNFILTQFEDSHRIWKSSDAYRFMTIREKLSHFYKCMDRDCIFTSIRERSFAQHLQDHAESYEKGGQAQMKDWKLCSYCCLVIDGVEAYMEHLSSEHGDCVVQCSYCFHRSKTIDEVKLHLRDCHADNPPCALYCHKNGTVVNLHKNLQRKTSSGV